MGAKSSVDVALVFPPLWYYPHPPHELAGLTAYLRARGRRVHAFDLNLDASLHFLSEPFLADVQSRLLREWDALSRRDRLSDAEGNRLVLLAKVLASGAHSVPAVAEALEIMRSESFYDVRLHEQAVRALHQVWELISVAYAPAQIGLGWFRTNHHDEETLQGCLDAATDTSCNPYVEYSRSVAVPRVLAMNPKCTAFIYVHPDQLVPMITMLAVLRGAGYAGHVTVTGNLEDQVTFGRYLQHGCGGGLDTLADHLDSVIYYDAEAALDILAGAIVGRQCTAEDIPNVGFFRGGKFVGPSSYAVTDLNAVPPPDYDDLDLDQYLFPDRVVSLLSSRGCYWDRCTFCAITTNHLRFRHRPADRVVDDLAHLIGRYGVRWVHFRDMLFSPAHARRLSTEIIERGLPVQWICRARFEDAFTTELLALMARAGCVQIWFGLESASQRVLDLMDKGTRVETASRIIKSCKSVGIGIHALVMHGFPTETEEEALDTVRFLEGHLDDIDSITYTDFILFAGTPIRKEPERFGLTVLEHPEKPFRHSLEYVSGCSPAANRGSYIELKSRLDESFETGLLHLAHVSLFRDRYGPGPWRPVPGSSDFTTNPSVRDVNPSGWRARTSWLKAHWDVRQLSRTGGRPRRRNCVLVSQAGLVGFVQLDCARTADDTGPMVGSVDDLVRVLAGGQDAGGALPQSVLAGLQALEAAGFIDMADRGADDKIGSRCSS
jgi:anaerobic magnesium-protoporphyrin IX monomethyl ester cyclase